MDEEILIGEADFIKLANGEAVEKQGVKVILSDVSCHFIQTFCPVVKLLHVMRQAWDKLPTA